MNPDFLTRLLYRSILCLLGLLLLAELACRHWCDFLARFPFSNF